MASCYSKLYASCGQDINSSNSSRLDVVATRKVIKTTGSLEIVKEDICGLKSSNSENGWPNLSGSPRPRSGGSTGSVPFRTNSSRSQRISTPTKQVTLQAVRRVEESPESFVDHMNWPTPAQDRGLRKHLKWAETSNILCDESESAKNLAHIGHLRPEPAPEHSQHASKLRLPQPGELDDKEIAPVMQNLQEGRVNALQEKNACGETDRKNDDTDEEESEEDDNSDSSEEKNERRAPNELLMEFVDCLMRKDFNNACKLCKMILLYEPKNPEALKFQPLIEEMLFLDAEAEREAADCSDEDDEEGTNDDGSSNEDDSDDDSSSSSEEGSDDDDDDGKNDEDHARPSGSQSARKYDNVGCK